jgi:hypothetical protein
MYIECTPDTVSADRLARDAFPARVVEQVAVLHQQACLLAGNITEPASSYQHLCIYFNNRLLEPILRHTEFTTTTPVG